MYRRLDSPEGARFLALILEGKGLKPSSRAAGVGKETGYRWLCEAFLELRGSGLGAEAAETRLGFSSSRVNEWERKFQQDDGRHHFQVDPDVEVTFWASYQEGASLAKATQDAGVSRATGYRWLYDRFAQLRASNGPARVRNELRLLPGTAATWDKRWKKELAAAKERLDRAHQAGIRDARLFAGRAAQKVSPAKARRDLTRTRYWDLVSAGSSNAEACRMLGMSRRAGTKLRNQRAEQSHMRVPVQGSGRYLSPAGADSDR